mgnify:CR=1 FL=1
MSKEKESKYSKSYLLEKLAEIGKEYVIPFPEKWAVEHFPEEVARWIEYMTGEELEAKTIKYTLSMHSYRGPIHIRAMWIRHWWLFLDDKGKGKVRAFKLEGFPLVETQILATYEGRVSRKYLDWEGKTKPNTIFNPNKELAGDMKIVTKGTVEYEIERLDTGEEVIHLHFKTGGLKGKWTLEQEEKGADTYAFYTTELPELQAKSGEFVYHRHSIGLRSHYDLRYVLEGEDIVKEFNIYGDLLNAGIEERIRAVRKTCSDLSWMDIKTEPEKRKVAGMWTLVEPIDYGKITVYNEGIDFVNFILHGKKFKDTYIVAKREPEGWYIFKSKLPGMEEIKLQNGKPSAGPYRDFQIEEKKTWDYFLVHIYDLRYFTRCEPTEKVKKYLPDLDIPEGVEVRVCLYPRAGTIHGARVAVVKFPKDKWTYEEAIKWIREHNLHTWSGEQIRETR